MVLRGLCSFRTIKRSTVRASALPHGRGRDFVVRNRQLVLVLLFALFTSLIGVTRPMNAVAHADAYGYDGPQPTPVEVAVSSATPDAPSQPCGGTAAVAQRFALTRGTSTTSAAGSVATNTADDWAESSGILRDATRGKGNFGLGESTEENRQTNRASLGWRRSDGRIGRKDAGLSGWAPAISSAEFQAKTRIDAGQLRVPMARRRAVADQRPSDDCAPDVRAVLRAALVPDESQRPLPDPLLVQLIVGADDLAGEESFEVLVTSSSQMAERARQGPVLGVHCLIVDELDVEQAVHALRMAVERVEGNSWPDLVAGLRLIGAWEFEGYSE